MSKQEQFRENKIEGGKIKTEVFKRLALDLEPANHLHTYTVTFESDSETMTRCYNAACRKVFKEHNLKAFHQSGSHEATGYQGWELFGIMPEEERDVVLVRLGPVLDEVHKEAEKSYKWWSGQE